MSVPAHTSAIPALSASDDPRQELRDLPEPLTTVPSSLWPVPGGWTKTSWTLGETTLELTLPAAPDRFLDDPEVERAFACDEYMPYWAYMWPSAVIAARQMLACPWRRGTTILELGCGLGLVGLAAARAGYRVVLTDYEPQSTDLVSYNAKQLGLPTGTVADDRTVDWSTHEAGAVASHVLDWRDPPATKYPVIVGCELLYELRNHEPLLNVLQTMLAPAGTAWLIDGGRQTAQRFWELAQAAGWHVRLFDERDQPREQPVVGRFQKFVLTRF